MPLRSEQVASAMQELCLSLLNAMPRCVLPADSPMMMRSLTHLAKTPPDPLKAYVSKVIFASPICQVSLHHQRRLGADVSIYLKTRPQDLLAVAWRFQWQQQILLRLYQEKRFVAAKHL